ncbi:MAG: hypothetical protein ACI867_000716 [Glaciecola sp.]|jgi:hypothetical protein
MLVGVRTKLGADQVPGPCAPHPVTEPNVASDDGREFVPGAIRLTRAGC